MPFEATAHDHKAPGLVAAFSPIIIAIRVADVKRLRHISRHVLHDLPPEPMWMSRPVCVVPVHEHVLSDQLVRQLVGLSSQAGTTVRAGGV